jgi:hypothetical protein
MPECFEELCSMRPCFSFCFESAFGWSLPCTAVASAVVYEALPSRALPAGQKPLTRGNIQRSSQLNSRGSTRWLGLAHVTSVGLAGASYLVSAHAIMLRMTLQRREAMVELNTSSTAEQPWEEKDGVEN